MPIVLIIALIIGYVPAAAKRQTETKPEHLKILAVGNSLSYNSLFYVFDMAKELGIEDVTVGNLYIGSCSLKRHWSNAQNDKKAYRYYKNTDGEWVVTGGVSISEALLEEDWDYVMFSQYSGDAGRTSTYKPLNKLLDYVKERVGENTVFVWNMQWAFQADYKAERFAVYDYDQMRMYEKIVRATKKKIVSNEKIAIVIPSGTAIQNARTSSFQDKFTTDGRHLTKYARYIVGITLLSRILGISPEQISFIPDMVTSGMRDIAVKSAGNALSKPYGVCDIS